MSLFRSTAHIDGLNFRLNDLPIPAKKKRHLRRGDYELPERLLISRFIQPGMQVLELGASIGIISTVIARKIGPSGSLLSVEADSSLRPFWERNLSSNHVRGTCVNALAAPSWDSTVPASLSGKNFQPSDDKLAGRAQSTAGAGPQAPWKTAFTICRENNFSPTALVVDIEGSETVWTEGPIGFPLSIKTIVVEFHPKFTGPDVAAQCAQAVLDDGFRLVGYQNNVFAFNRP